MTKVKVLGLGVWWAVVGLAASGGGGSNKPPGGGGGGGGVQPAGIAEVRSLNETVPAGGVVQVKYSLTTPRPISGGGPRMDDWDFEVNGVGISSPLGTTAGVALSHNGTLAVEIVSPDSDYGTNLDYPFLTIAMTVPAITKPGTAFPLRMQDTLVSTPTGPVTLSNTKVGTLTVGGTVSIRGLVPGGGTWPAGTIVRVQGTGFVPGTRLTSKMKTTNPVYVSPTEMVFALTSTTTLDEQPVTASNPDGSTVTYYSYLRGVPVRAPSRALLLKADPIFQQRTRGAATLGPLPGLAPGQFTGLAIQNPSTGPVIVALYHPRTGRVATILLASGTRIMDELGALLNGASLEPGDVVQVNATSGVQILGLTGDDTAFTLKPWLPAF